MFIQYLIVRKHYIYYNRNINLITKHSQIRNPVKYIEQVFVKRGITVRTCVFTIPKMKTF